jgi:hypothetical protein
MNYYRKDKGNLFQYKTDDNYAYKFEIGCLMNSTSEELSYEYHECNFFYKSNGDFIKENE